jgi:hypothetical protein
MESFAVKMPAAVKFFPHPNSDPLSAQVKLVINKPCCLSKIGGSLGLRKPDTVFGNMFIFGALSAVIVA